MAVLLSLTMNQFQDHRLNWKPFRVASTIGAVTPSRPNTASTNCNTVCSRYCNTASERVDIAIARIQKYLDYIVYAYGVELRYD